MKMVPARFISALVATIMFAVIGLVSPTIANAQIAGEEVEIDCLELDERMLSLSLQATEMRCFLFEKGITECKMKLKEVDDSLSNTPGWMPIISHENELRWANLSQQSAFVLQCFNYPSDKTQAFMIITKMK